MILRCENDINDQCFNSLETALRLFLLKKQGVTLKFNSKYFTNPKLVGGSMVKHNSHTEA